MNNSLVIQCDNNKKKMRKIVQPKRVHTEPNADSRYRASIKVEGTIFVQKGANKPNRSDILTVKPNNKIQYHCFKRYKSFPYTFTEVCDQISNNCLQDCLLISNPIQAVEKNNNYLLYCSGVFDRTDKELKVKTYNIFYSQLEKVFNSFIKSNLFTMKLQCLVVGEDSVYDLISNKNVQLREVSVNKNLNSCDVHFVGVQYHEVQTLYQLYDLIQKTTQKKDSMFHNSYYLIECQLTSTKGNAQRKKLIFIDGTKDISEQNKNWDNFTVLVLNKCVLGLYNKMENKDNYCPYRDSKLTRIMKPFLTFNSRIDVLGFLNRDDEEYALSTLNLVKNMSRLRIDTLPSFDSQNPEIESRLEELKKQNDEIKGKLKEIESFQSLKGESQKQNLLEEIQKNAGLEKDTLLNLQKLRKNNKIIRTKKWLRELGLGLGTDSQSFQGLQEEQIEYEEKVERELVGKLENINKSRVETINKSISKVEQLKLMQQYFTLALNSQKEENKYFHEQQATMKRIYEENIKIIENNLKKSPKQLLESVSEKKNNNLSTKSSKKRNSASNTSGIHDKPHLPYISNSLNKRLSLKKKTEKMGRVDYQSFLQKNIQQYRSYETPSNKRKQKQK